MLTLAGFTLAGCGGGGSSPAATPTTATTVAPTTTTALEDLARQYLTIVAPLQVAAGTFSATMNTLGDSPQASALQSVAAPFVTAERTADEQLLRVAWPPAVKPDIDSFVTANRALETELGTAGNQTVVTAGAWIARVVAAEGKLSAAVSIVRADLGLPPAST